MGNWKSVLVIYDIGDTKIRNKVVKELESYGVRIQKSAFECYVDDSRLSRMIVKIQKVTGENDSVRIYSPSKSVFDIGKGEDVKMYSQGMVII